MIVPLNVLPLIKISTTLFKGKMSSPIPVKAFNLLLKPFISASQAPRQGATWWQSTRRNLFWRRVVHVQPRTQRRGVDIDDGAVSADPVSPTDRLHLDHSHQKRTLGPGFQPVVHVVAHPTFRAIRRRGVCGHRW